MALLVMLQNCYNPLEWMEKVSLWETMKKLGEEWEDMSMSLWNWSCIINWSGISLQSSWNDFLAGPAHEHSIEHPSKSHHILAKTQFIKSNPTKILPRSVSHLTVLDVNLLWNHSPSLLSFPYWLIGFRWGNKSKLVSEWKKGGRKSRKEHLETKLPTN